MTVVRKCDSPQELCQLVGVCDGHGASKGDWGGVTVDQKCDINQRGVKDIIKVCQLMGRCDGYKGDARRCEKV